MIDLPVNEINRTCEISWKGGWYMSRIKRKPVAMHHWTDACGPFRLELDVVQSRLPISCFFQTWL